VQPAFIRVIDENSKNTLSTGAILGPINEGSTISLNCESGRGKPVPTVEWFQNNQLLEGKICNVLTLKPIRSINLYVPLKKFRKH